MDLKKSIGAKYTNNKLSNKSNNLRRRNKIISLNKDVLYHRWPQINTDTKYSRPLFFKKLFTN